LTTDECAQGAAIVAVPTANLIPEVPDTLRSGSSNPASHGKVNGTDRMTLIPVTMAHGQAGAEIGIGIGIGIGTTLSCNHEAPIVFKPEMVAFTENQRNEVREMEVAGALPTIRRGDAKNETLLAVAFRSEMGGNDGGVYEDGCTPTMTSAPPAVAFQERGRKDGRSLEIGGDVAFALTSPNGGGRAQERNVLTPSMSVRRLTPRECERLQGFPDDYTAIPCRGKPAADGPRYKALGNSKAVPVVRWIGRRIEKELTRSHEGTEEKKP
jgi:DNA (cytosine-5)-methyltransferase 1